MENIKKGMKTGATEIYSTIVKDDVTYEKIHRHLTDINDIISEEDIRNIKIHTGIVRPDTITSKKRTKIFQ